MNEIVFILIDQKDESMHYVLFDRRLSFRENFKRLAQIDSHFKGSFILYFEQYCLDLDLPLQMMGLYSGVVLKVYSHESLC